MAKKAFSKRIKEIMDGVKKTKDGKINSSFSRKFYDDVAGAVLNDPDYEFEEYKVRNGKPVATVTKPSRVFRDKVLYPIAKGFGIDDADAKKFSDDYEFTNTQAGTMYDLMAAINWEYMNSGKILRLPSKKDFVGSINITDAPADVYTNEHLGVRVKRNGHKVLQKRSNTPPWCKEKF